MAELKEDDEPQMNDESEEEGDLDMDDPRNDDKVDHAKEKKKQFKQKEKAAIKKEKTKLTKANKHEEVEEEESKHDYGNDDDSNNFDAYGFEEDEAGEGDEFLAVKPWIG